MGFIIRGALAATEIFDGKRILDLAETAKKRGLDLFASAERAGHSLEADAKGGALYFRAKMLGYDLPNGNGDAIDRIYASDFGPSFIGRHLDVNHETDIQNIIGKILSTFHIEADYDQSGDERIVGKNALAEDDTDYSKELQLEGVCRIDRNTDLGEMTAQKLSAGTINGVSQEASTDYAECSVCGHKVMNPFSKTCAHMEPGTYMVRAFQVEGRKRKILAYKRHANPVGTGLAVVTVPAYDKGRVMEMVNAALKGKMPITAALLELRVQEQAYGRNEVLVEAHKMLKGTKTVTALESALTKLNGVETLALLNKFGVKADGREFLDIARDEIREGAAQAEDAKDKAEEALASVSPMSEEPVNVEKAIEKVEEAEGAAAKAQDSLKDGREMAEAVTAGVTTGDEFHNARLHPRIQAGSTARTEIIDGIPVTVPNVVTPAKDFYVSYNNYDTATYGSDTTALVEEGKTGTHFYVLNGDHRKEYDKLIPLGFAACFEYFKAHQDQKNKYSEKAYESEEEKQAYSQRLRKLLQTPAKVKAGAKEDKEHLELLKDIEKVEKKEQEHAMGDAENKKDMAKKIEEIEEVEATFMRKPNLLSSYWLLSDKSGKVLGRFTVGALSAGKLDRKVKIMGTQMDLRAHLTTESWAKEFKRVSKELGADKVLAQLMAVQKAWSLKGYTALPTTDEREAAFEETFIEQKDVKDKDEESAFVSPGAEEDKMFNSEVKQTAKTEEEKTDTAPKDTVVALKLTRHNLSKIKADLSVDWGHIATLLGLAGVSVVAMNALYDKLTRGDKEGFKDMATRVVADAPEAKKGLIRRALAKIRARKINLQAMGLGYTFESPVQKERGWYLPIVMLTERDELKPMGEAGPFPDEAAASSYAKAHAAHGERKILSVALKRNAHKLAAGKVEAIANKKEYTYDEVSQAVMDRFGFDLDDLEMLDLPREVGGVEVETPKSDEEVTELVDSYGGLDGYLNYLAETFGLEEEALEAASEVFISFRDFENTKDEDPEVEASIRPVNPKVEEAMKTAGFEEIGKGLFAVLKQGLEEAKAKVKKAIQALGLNLVEEGPRVLEVAASAEKIGEATPHYRGRDQYAYWEWEGQTFPRTNFEAGTITKNGDMLNLRTGEVFKKKTVEAAAPSGKVKGMAQESITVFAPKEHVDKLQQVKDFLVSRDQAFDEGDEMYTQSVTTTFIPGEGQIENADEAELMALVESLGLKFKKGALVEAASVLVVFNEDGTYHPFQDEGEAKRFLKRKQEEGPGEGWQLGRRKDGVNIPEDEAPYEGDAATGELHLWLLNDQALYNDMRKAFDPNTLEGRVRRALADRPDVKVDLDDVDWEELYRDLEHELNASLKAGSKSDSDEDVATYLGERYEDQSAMYPELRNKVTKDEYIRVNAPWVKKYYQENAKVKAEVKEVPAKVETDLKDAEKAAAEVRDAVKHDDPAYAKDAAKEGEAAFADVAKTVHAFNLACELYKLHASTEPYGAEDEAHLTLAAEDGDLLEVTIKQATAGAIVSSSGKTLEIIDTTKPQEILAWALAKGR